MEKHGQFDGPGGADSHEQLELLKKVYDASPRSFISSDGDGGGSGCCRSGESKWLFGRSNPVPAEARMLQPPMTRTHRQLGTLRNTSTPHAAIPDQRVIIHDKSTTLKVIGRHATLYRHSVNYCARDTHHAMGSCMLGDGRVSYSLVHFGSSRWFLLGVQV